MVQHALEEGIFVGKGREQVWKGKSRAPFWTCEIRDTYKAFPWKYKINLFECVSPNIRGEKTGLEIEIWESSVSRDYLKAMVLDEISVQKERDIEKKKNENKESIPNPEIHYDSLFPGLLSLGTSCLMSECSSLSWMTLLDKTLCVVRVKAWLAPLCFMPQPSHISSLIPFILVLPHEEKVQVQYLYSHTLGFLKPRTVDIWGLTILG